MIRIDKIDTIEEIVANSYFDFHVKGFDYVCLHRSERITDKVYFFNGDVRKLPEVVNPHDHRYNFLSTALTGRVKNHNFVRRPMGQNGEVFQAFDYRTPLNGGSGFTWRGEEKLQRISTYSYGAGEGYFLAGEDLHTIQIVEEGTVLWLRQLQDKIPLDQPTSTWTRNKEPPSLSGLYRKPKADEVVKYLRQLGLTE